MNKQEIFDLLSTLPQFIEPDYFNLAKDNSLNEDWLRLYDLTSYKWISINDGVIQYVLENGVWFSIEENDLDDFIEMQKDKADNIRVKIVEEKGLNGVKILETLEEIKHLNKGVIQSEDTEFSNEWIYFINTNNGQVLSFNQENESFFISNGGDDGYFEDREKILKLVMTEKALDTTKIKLIKSNVANIEGELDENTADKITTQLPLKKLL